ncbi:MAG: hypothetical protein OEZ43_01160 [Gammaproteobacteria bacterium]|nr:hypothetical protein [Gammaproteobacteria bacterium]
MNKQIKPSIYGTKLSCFLIIPLLTLSACSESIPDTNAGKQQASNTGQQHIGTRALTVDEQLTSAIGSGFRTTAANLPTNGFVGNIGGYNLNGTIAGIIGNTGGFGGFGAFISFFTGSLPVSPPGGGAGVLPPGLGNGTPPPGLGAGLPPGIGGGTPPFTPPAGSLPLPASTADTSLFVSSVELSDTSSAFIDTDIDLVLVGRATSSAPSFSILAVTETTIPCRSGGSVTILKDDVAPVGFSTGDNTTFTFANCVRGLNGNITLNGSRGFSVDAATGTPFVDPTWSSNTSMFRKTLSRANATTGNTHIASGNSSTSISVSPTNESQTASGSGSAEETTSTGATSHTYNFDVDFAADKTNQSFNFTLSISIVGDATIAVATPTPFNGTIGSAPTAGQMTVKRSSATNSETQTLTAQADGSILVEIDTNGDGIPDSTSTQASWAQVLSQLFNSPI